MEKNDVSEQLKSYGGYDENHPWDDIKLWKGEEWVEYEEWVLERVECGGLEGLEWEEYEEWDEYEEWEDYEEWEEYEEWDEYEEWEE